MACLLLPGPIVIPQAALFSNQKATIESHIIESLHSGVIIIGDMIRSPFPWWYILRQYGVGKVDIQEKYPVRSPSIGRRVLEFILSVAEESDSMGEMIDGLESIATHNRMNHSSSPSLLPLFAMIDEKRSIIQFL